MEKKNSGQAFVYFIFYNFYTKIRTPQNTLRTCNCILIMMHVMKCKKIFNKQKVRWFPVPSCISWNAALNIVCTCIRWRMFYNEHEITIIKKKKARLEKMSASFFIFGQPITKLLKLLLSECSFLIKCKLEQNK
jgi:hypothetical protein